MTRIIELRDVDAHNWRACADLEVVPEQRDFVSPVARYLCLCHFGGVWHPLAVYAGDEASAAALSRPSPAACWRPGAAVPAHLATRPATRPPATFTGRSVSSRPAR